MRIDSGNLDHVVTILQTVDRREFVKRRHPQRDDGSYDSGDVDVVCELLCLAKVAV